MFCEFVGIFSYFIIICVNVFIVGLMAQLQPIDDCQTPVMTLLGHPYWGIS
jgi:hypothetical protein